MTKKIKSHKKFSDLSKKAGITIEEISKHSGTCSRTVNNSVHVLVEMMEKKNWVI